MPQSPDLAVQLDECAREPIHISASIQPHGMLFAVTQPDLLLAAVSENVAAALRLDPEELIGGRIGQFLDDRSAERLAALLRGDSIASSVTVQLRHPAPPSQWDAMVHRSGRLNLVELEPRSADDVDERLSDQVRTGIERIRTGIERIRQSASVAEACVSLAQAIRALSGYDRVMVYRFDANWNGEVVAEDKLAEMHAYFGHSFPASDIPAQARALYVHNAFRLIPDARYTPCRIVPAIDPTTDAPIDLSGANLRSVSPIHCEYLANMGVVGSMSVSVIKDGALWGLVACHHRTARFVSYAVRQSCELLTLAMTSYLDTSERISFAHAIESVRTLETAATGGSHENHDCRGVLESIAPALLDQAGAQGMALYNPNRPLDDGHHAERRTDRGHRELAFG